MLRRQAAGSGTWVIDRIDDYRFDVLVVPDHAFDADWGLGVSQLSKLSGRGQDNGLKNSAVNGVAFRFIRFFNCR